MKVIFLDFDGVLAPYGSRYEPGKFSKAPVKNFNKILEADLEVLIVVSSSWRSHGLKYVKEMLERNGINQNRVIGITPKDETKSREHHIEMYLEENENVKKFVILDDDHIGVLKSHWIRINKFVGLTEADAEKAIEILK
jgi:HAD domain in Swiss Army Knife RNA repair proteins